MKKFLYFVCVLALCLLFLPSTVADAAVYKFHGRTFDAPIIFVGDSGNQVITCDSFNRTYYSVGQTKVTINGTNVKKYSWSGSAWSESAAYTAQELTNFVYNDKSTQFSNASWNENYGVYNSFGGLASNPWQESLVEFVDGTSAYFGFMQENYFVLELTYPVGETQPETLHLNISYTLPSNNYANDLYHDYQTIVNGGLVFNIGNNYKKTFGSSATKSYDYNISDLERSAPDSIDNVYHIYYLKVPFDKVELGLYALNHVGDSNIAGLTPYVNGIVSMGYINSVEAYGLSTTGQSVIRYATWTDSQKKALTQYSIGKVVDDVQSGDISQAATDAYRDTIIQQTQELYEKDREQNSFASAGSVISGGDGFVSAFNGIVGTITGLFSGLTAMGSLMSVALGWLPQPFPTLITFTLVSLLVISIYKALRG